MKVLITIPALNEGCDLSSTIQEIRAVMEATSYDYKIHVYDDGSIDSTSELAKRYADYVTRGPVSRGLAKVFLAEMQFCLEANADIIVHIDADGQYEPSVIPEMIQKVENGADLVIGSRFFQGNRYSGALVNNIGNILGSFILGKIIGLQIADFTSGFRVFRKEVALTIPIISSFTYTQEQIIRAHHLGMQIAEIPVQTRKTRASRLFRNPLVYIIKSLFSLIKVFRECCTVRYYLMLSFALFFVLSMITFLSISSYLLYQLLFARS